MKKIKSCFLVMSANLTRDIILQYENLPYTKVCVLYTGKKDITEKKTSPKLEILSVSHGNDLARKMKQVFETYMEYRIIPHFTWDDNSRHAIKVYNQSFGTKIDAKIFKEKDKMQKFLWDISHKEYLKMNYREVMYSDYATLTAQVGNNFIIKPTNSSSSRSAFKINSAEGFEAIKLKLARWYEYIIEEYLDGELYSLDFFMTDGKIYLLTYAREIAMIELSDKKKFSKGFLEKYGEELEKHFNFMLPLAYHMDFSQLNKRELSFLEELRKKLAEIEYRGVIHLEYKYDKVRKKIWFIEWGARYGGYRSIFIKKIYNTDTLKIPHYLLIEKDASRFHALKHNILCLKEQEHNLNFVRVKTNFTKTTNYISILKKTGGIFESSLSQFLKEYYMRVFGIKIKNIDFFVKYSPLYNFFPFYHKQSTRLDYILELDDANFELFKKKKFQIIEKTFFHDYNS